MMPSTNRCLAALIVGFAMSPLVQAQLKTFKPGDVIKSSEINENFEYLEEQIGSAGNAASAQCSATQDGSSVVISCSDGSSAVLAGAGTVVTYPEGGVIGESPTQTWSTGSIVYVDAADTILAEVESDDYFLVKIPYASLEQVGLELGDSYRFTYVNDEESQRTILTSPRQRTLYFLTEDCFGTGFLNNGPYDDDGTFYIKDRSFLRKDLLTKSSRFSRYESNSILRAQGGCEKRERVQDVLPAVEWTPPPELANPVCPVRLEQLP